jgi:tetratricopeptide (TPR) repeat protein
MRRNGFVDFDDPLYVTENPHVNGGITLESFVWAFTATHVSNWHPLTWLSHMLDCQLFRLNPLWHHLTSLLFHVTNTLLLFWVLKRMTGALWPSAFVAAVFALHPLHVESVAWLAERKDVLSSFFWMLTMAVYLRYAERPTIGRHLLVVLTLALGLMAKPMLVTLPFVLLLLDFWPLGRLQWHRQTTPNALPQPESRKARYQRSPLWHVLAEKIPLFILVLASSVITFIAQQKGGSMTTIENLPLNLRMANAPVSYIKYIGKMIYPNHLAVLYPLPSDGWPLWQPIVSFLILAGLSAGIIYTARRRYLVVGWLWYLGTLLPVIGFVQVGLQAIADRYTYMPSIGILIIIAWAAAEFTANWRHRKIALSIAAALLLSALLIATRAQVRHWHDNLTIHQHTIAVTENNYIMHDSYGYGLLKKGRLQEAVEQFNEALRLKPHYLKAINHLGVALKEQGKLQEATACFKKALQLEPGHLGAHYNLGLAMADQGKYDQAVNNFNKVLQAKLDSPQLYIKIALACSLMGKYELAIQSYNQALRTEPGNAMVHANLAVLFTKQGNLDQAVTHYTEVLRVKPDFADAHANLGQLLALQGKPAQAIRHYTRALQLEPDSPALMNNLAWILATHKQAQLRDPKEAIRLAERACELTKYEQPGILDTLAAAYAAAGRFQDAIETAGQAINLAEAAGKESLAQEIQKHLQLYQAGRPYREK